MTNFQCTGQALSAKGTGKREKRLPAEGSGGPPGGGGSSAGCEAWDVLKIGEIQSQHS